MGVVRREGDWRLVKRGEGSYEITYQRDPQMKVFTPDFSSPGFGAAGWDAVPSRNVDSFSEAEGLFEEMAHGSPPLGYDAQYGGAKPSDSLNRGSDAGSSLDEGVASDLEEADVPPGGFAMVLILVGGLMIYVSGFSPGSMVFLVGGVFIISGLAIFGWSGLILRTRGHAAAREFLLSSEGEFPESASSDTQDRVPPLSEKYKNQLIFDRADQHCEWCEERFDHLQVHHIKPRSAGGPNRPGNLIVLCPTCHDKADRNTMAQSKLRGKVRRAPDIEFE